MWWYAHVWLRWGGRGMGSKQAIATMKPSSVVDPTCLVMTVFVPNSPCAQTKGLSVVSDPEKDKTMIQQLLELKDHVDRIVEGGFKAHDAVMYVGKHAFERIINARDNRPAEMIGELAASCSVLLLAALCGRAVAATSPHSEEIACNGIVLLVLHLVWGLPVRLRICCCVWRSTAKFVDGYLRAGEIAVSEAEADAALSKVMVLFRSVHGKDAFEAFYKRDLAKRLLLNKSASLEMERGALHCCVGESV